MTDSDWETLLSRIQLGRCTPFLGSGVHAGALPLARDIASRWARQYGYPLNRDADDLARVAQFLAVTRSDGIFPKEKLIAELRDAAETAEISNLLRAIAALPLPIYITANDDDLLGKALRACAISGDPDMAHYPEGGFIQSIRRTVRPASAVPSRVHAALQIKKEFRAFPETPVAWARAAMRVACSMMPVRLASRMPPAPCALFAGSL